MIDRRNAIFSLLAIPVAGQISIVKSVNDVDYVDQNNLLDFTLNHVNFVKSLSFDPSLLKRKSGGHYDFDFIITPCKEVGDSLTTTKPKLCYKTFPYILKCKNTIYHGVFGLSTKQPKWHGFYIGKSEPEEFNIYLPEIVHNVLFANSNLSILNAFYK